MNPLKKNKLFSKYMAGDISQDEMHELNQYALEDDFLFEALEGAAGFEVGNKNAIEDLNIRLKAKNKKKRSPLFIWTSVAATIAILIIAFTFIPDLENEPLSDMVIKKEIQVSPTEDDLSVEYASESEPEIASNKKEIPTASPPPAAKSPPEHLKSHKPIVIPEENDDLEEVSNEQIAFKVQPEEERDIASLETITLADAELKKTQSSEIEIKQIETISTIERDSDDKVGQSAPKPVIAQARKRKESNRNTFLDQGVSEGAKAEILEDESGLSIIRITFDEEKIGLQFQEYIAYNFNSKGFSDLVIIDMIVNEKQEATKIDIKTPLNSSQTRKIINLVESFKEWGEAGNKTLQIMFNK